MTATDPRPELAAMPAERLAPAAAALAEACAEDMSAGPPPEDGRALAERHRAGRAALSHLRQFIGLLDRAAAHMPEPEQAPAGEPGSGHDGSENVYCFGKRQYAGRLTTPAFRGWLARQERREAADMAAREAAAGGGGGWQSPPAHVEPPPLSLLASGGRPPPLCSPPARREGLGEGLSARRGVAGLHGRWPPPGLPRKRGRRFAAAVIRSSDGRNDWTASCPKRLQHMNSEHAEHDIP